jgi:hypothetical protein
MKNFLFATVTAFSLLAFPALACETKPVEGSNYTVKVDPTCQFADNQGGEGFLFLSVDDDQDVTTPNKAAVALSKSPDAYAVIN